MYTGFFMRIMASEMISTYSGVSCAFTLKVSMPRELARAISSAVEGKGTCMPLKVSSVVVKLTVAM